VEVIDLMPPAVKTELTTEMQEGEGVALISTDKLIKQSFAGFKAGKLEIRPGQSNLLALMKDLNDIGLLTPEQQRQTLDALDAAGQTLLAINTARRLYGYDAITAKSYIEKLRNARTSHRTWSE
jgi:hypothetical protein